MKKHPNDDIQVRDVADSAGAVSPKRVSVGNRLKNIMSRENPTGLWDGVSENNGVGGSKVQGKLQKKDRHGRWQVRKTLHRGPIPPLNPTILLPASVTHPPYHRSGGLSTARRT